jgi:hypothetical protein
MFQVLAIYYNNRATSNLETKYNLKKNISLKQFLNIFLSKIYIKELNTEGILAFKEVAFT